MALEKVEGNINVSFTCDCPHCDNQISTDHDTEFKQRLERINKYWFCQLADKDMENIVIECTECKKSFIVEKFTY